MTRLVSLALLGALVATPAYAQAPKTKYTRNTPVQVQVSLSERVKPSAPKPGEVAKPIVTSELALSIEGLRGRFQAEQEQILRDLIAQTPDREVDEKADLYFRLGELLAKQQRYWRLRSIDLELRGKKVDAEAAAKKARELMVSTVGVYKELTDSDAFRNYPKMDVALFYYGYTLHSGKYLKEARAAYDKLLKNYPSSKYVPEAHFAFGEYYFEAAQLNDAEGRYRKVLEFPHASVYWHAMYKLGWIHLNQQRHQEALETFYKVAQATKGNAKEEVLNRAARKDFVRAFAEVGKAEKAYAAFAKLDDKRAFEMLEVLADLYLEQGKSERAIFTYQELMKRAPSHKRVCLWQYDVAHATLSMPRDGAGGDAVVTKAVVKEAENLTRLWGVLKGKAVLPQPEANECRDNAAAMSGELARAYHSEWAKTKNADTLAHAEKLYRVYLDVFPDAKDYPETSYYYAELLWARAEAERNPRLATELWEQAANAFAEVTKRGKLNAKLLKEAAYANVLGWKNALDIDPNLAKLAVKAEDVERDEGAVPKPREIPAKEQKMLAAFRTYVTFVKDKNDDERIRMLFLEANTYRRYNQVEKAIPLFLEVLANHREHETAEWSANLLLDTYNRQKRFKEMIALVDKLAADGRFLDGKPELSELLGRLRVQYRRKEAEDLERRGRAAKDFALLTACGGAYMDIYNADPEAKENDQILYNALVCYHEGKSVSAAIKAFNTLKQYYGSSKLMPRAVGRIGKAYGDVAFYEQAAEKLEEYAKKYGGEKDAYEALSDAVTFRKGTGHDDKAIADTKYFVATFGTKRPAEAANAMYSLTSVYEKQGDGDAVVKHLRAYIRQFGAKGGMDRLVMAHAKIGQQLWAQSCPVKQVDGSCVKIVRERAISLRRQQRSAQQTQCGEASKIKLTVVPRDERKVRDAFAAFALATKEYEKAQGQGQRKIGGDEAGARYFYAQSRLALADRDFEAYLARAFPQGLDFDPRRESVKAKSLQRLDAWVAEKTKIGAKATAQYEAVLALKESATSIAAAARIAQISQHFSDALFTAEIPKDVRSGEFADEKVEAFCDRMTEIAEPLEARALEGFRTCLGKSTELGWFSDWSKLCERELGQIRPEEFPTASELRGRAKVALTIAIEGPIARLD